LEQVAFAIVNPSNEHGISSTVPVEVNGLEALEVSTFSQYGEGSFTLIPFSDELVILFGPSQADHPDIQAILQSITVDPAAEVVLPKIKPANPPEGMAAACIGKMEASAPDAPDANPLTGKLDCAQVTDEDALMWVLCNVQDSFLSRNTQPLFGYMEEPFLIGYWQSEGANRTREEALEEIINNYLAETPGGETFTLDRSQFPPLFGTPPENMFGPDDNPDAIVYSEGWGKEGQGAALLYFKQASDGRYVFYAMVIAPGHFDK
jgi:hypothetical protein